MNVDKIKTRTKMDIDEAVVAAHKSGYLKGQRSVLRVFGYGAQPSRQNMVCAMASDVDTAQQMWSAHVDGLMRAAAEFSNLAQPLIGAEHPLVNWL